MYEDTSVTAGAYGDESAGPAPEGPHLEAAAANAPGERAGPSLRWREMVSPAAALALLVGLAVTAVLSLVCLGLYNRNEHHLLTLRVRELALVLSETVPSVQTPLASGAALADATNGAPARFRELLAPEVGPGKQFASVSLWPLRTPQPPPTVIVGTPPALASDPSGREELAALARRPGVLNLTGLLGGSRRPSLGYVYTAKTPMAGFAVYAENPLPADRRSKLQSNSAFADLNYVLYLGRSRKPSNLLVTSLNSLPLQGAQASATVPFGSGIFTLVVGAKGPLGGTFFKDLPWIVALVGALISLAAAALIERLVRRRRRAEQLAQMLDRVAAENRTLYMEQRSISSTLQHALLPASLPSVRGLDMDARYVPAPSGGEVGGDWYDVVALEGDHVAMVVGDVSGHGLQAATTMALVRHAALAYLAQDSRPATVLSKLSRFVNGTPHTYFATVLCALIDVSAHRITLASAGHLPPLVLESGGGRFAKLSASPPVGFPGSWEYHETTIDVQPGATLVAFTDGLVEHRGEVLDVGLDRLRELAGSARSTVEELLAKLVREMTSEQSQDDTALVGIQWKG